LVGSLGTLRLTGILERHRSGENVATERPTGTGKYRSVLPIDEGEGWALEASYARRQDGRGITTSAEARVGKFEGQSYASLWWESTVVRQLNWSQATIEGSVLLGLSSETSPVQSLYLMGGRHTLPGYAYRSFVGDQMLLMRIEGSRHVFAPWLSLRAFGVTGKTSFGSRSLPEGWPAQSTRGFETSAGLGIGLGWDLLHLDAGRGLNEGGEWEFVLSVQRRFWEWL